MRIDPGDDEQPEIGLIALIDCIFFLLMFFMVATSFKQKEEHRKEKDLPIVLPKSAAALDRSDAAPEPLVIGIDQRGAPIVGAGKMSLQDLQERLHEEAAKDPARPVRIDGDGRVPYQAIVNVLDLCQFEGLTNISMHARH